MRSVDPSSTLCDNDALTWIANGNILLGTIITWSSYSSRAFIHSRFVQDKRIKETAEKRVP